MHGDEIFGRAIAATCITSSRIQLRRRLCSMISATVTPAITKSHSTTISTQTLMVLRTCNALVTHYSHRPAGRTIT
jgi:hypothetical protein